MRLPDEESTQDSTERWWKGWRQRDFSWQALKVFKLAVPVQMLSSNRANAGTDTAGPAEPEEPLDKPEPSEGDTDDWEGVGPFTRQASTLQDYWRREPATTRLRDDAELLKAGELETGPDGRLWHIAHVPFDWSDGKPSWKADRDHVRWGQFWSVIRARLDEATHDGMYALDAINPFEQVEPAFPPPAQLAGVIFGEPPAAWNWQLLYHPLNAQFTRSAFLGEASFSYVRTAGGLDMRSCLFARPANFDGARVGGPMSLTGSSFLSRLEMDGCTINGELEISDCRLHGPTTLLRATVDGKLKCHKSIFHRVSGFDKTDFRGGAAFGWCRFVDLASFDSVRVRKDVEFVSVRFGSDVNFSGRADGNFACVACRFEDAFSLGRIVVRGTTFLDASRFDDWADFQHLRLRGRASWSNTRFGSLCTFKDVRLRGEVEFHNASFEGAADFKGCLLPDDPARHHGAFRGADFRRTADFTIDGFSAWAAFAECNFQQRLLLPRTALDSNRRFEEAIEAAKRSTPGPTTAKTGTQGRGQQVKTGGMSKPDMEPLAELESAFQCVKQAMARQQSRLDEHRFYRWELLTNGSRPNVSRTERVLLAGYDAISRCGNDFVRPLTALLALTMLFAVGYWAISLPGSDLLASLTPWPPRGPDPNLLEAFRMSVQNVVQPLDTWKAPTAEAIEAEEWAHALLTKHGLLWGLVMRLVATAQSLMSLALLFLAALALKRRFQMNACGTELPEPMPASRLRRE